MLKFITGNKNKFLEIQKMLAPVKIELVNIDLEEIQDLDPHKIIKHKLQQAFKHHKGEFIVEDGSLYLDCLEGKLPGPFIRWFNESMGNKGLVKLATKMGNNKANAKVLIGYAKNSKEIIFFEGNIKGKIVKPKGKYGFGYDPVFMPSGSNKVYAELKSKSGFNGKDLKLSPRGLAITKLKKYLLKK